MMFPKVFGLIALGALGCTAAHIDNFKAISTGVTIDKQKSRAFQLLTKDMDMAIEECARRCLLIPYFCHSFTVESMNSDLKSLTPFKCQMFTTSEANWISNLSDSDIEVELYVTLQPEQVQDIAARLSHNDEKHEDWASDIQIKYGLLKRDHVQNQLDQEVLRVCNFAIHGEPPMSVDIGPQLIDLTLDSWAQYSTESDTLSKGFDTIVLTFLEIFSKNADKDVTTFYDPTKKTLSIQNKDLYLLIVSFGSGHYEIFRHTKSLKHLIQVTIAPSVVEIDNEKKTVALEIFKKSVARDGLLATIPYPPIRFQFSPIPKDEQSIASAALIMVAGSLFQPQSLPISVSSNQETIFYRDIVTAVLSSVYEKIRARRFRTSLFQKTKTGALTDTTQRTKLTL